MGARHGPGRHGTGSRQGRHPAASGWGCETGTGVTHSVRDFPGLLRSLRGQTCVSIIRSNSAWPEWPRRGFYLAEKLHH